jgi:UV excision repair protein RAD23
MLSSPPPPNPFASSAGSLDPNAKVPSGGKKHQRIPSVVLSPSPSNENLAQGEKPKEILLDLDAEASVPLSPVLRDELTLSSSYHDTISKPEFWQRLLEFLEYVFFVRPSPCVLHTLLNLT